MTKTIDGKAIGMRLQSRIADQIKALKSSSITPGLAVILVGEDPASAVYVRNKAKQSKAVGMESFEYRLEATVSEEKLLSLISELNSNDQVHGILVQLPLPKHISSDRVIHAIAPEKDVDGFHISNAGKLATGQRSMVPCTPLGSIILLKAALGSLSGLHAVIIGRSNIVGKPLAQLLLAQDCTVTIAHSKSRNLKEIASQADILVACAGRARLIDEDFIKPGAVVIDVGINRITENGKAILVGDVDFEAVVAKASAITPVPGGVGPMTIACLLANTVTACHRINGLPDPQGLALETL